MASIKIMHEIYSKQLNNKYFNVSVKFQNRKRKMHFFKIFFIATYECLNSYQKPEKKKSKKEEEFILEESIKNSTWC